ncbi:class I adenylate-forming enzyme family protein [Paraburkholderia sediminicola]|uniref:class I adenylate-forming enzyme family protein n=1 Tax=Paraburkholderia sediminicola TaxID=458836 RepID=UPI0038B754A0
MRLFDFLDKAVNANADAIAVRYRETKISYRELQSCSRRIANALRSEGLESGARVAIWAPNHPMFFACQFGVHRTPYVWIALSPKSTVGEVVSLLSGTNVECMFLHSDFIAHIETVRHAVSSLRKVICIDEAPVSVHLLTDWLKDVNNTVNDTDVRPNDIVMLRNTGGSTGRPKSVMRPSIAWATTIADYASALPYDTRPINLIVTPLSHVSGEIAMSIFAVGGEQIIHEDTDPRSILQAIEQFSVTTLFLPPTLIYSILALPEAGSFDLSSLRYVMYGSMPMSVNRLKDAWRLFGPVMTQLYGLSESASTTSILSPIEHGLALKHDVGRLASCGRGGPNSMVDVVDTDGCSLAPNQRGEIVSRSLNLMLGYLDNPEETAHTLRDGRLHTGDIGYRDVHGYIYIVDRLKDIIISGAFNIYPSEIEQVIWTHPAIQDCAVIGVPDEKWGEAVTAVVELKIGMQLQETELIDYCKKALGSIKAPKNVVIWETLPKSAFGKVLKKDIRAQFWKGKNRVI